MRKLFYIILAAITIFQAEQLKDDFLNSHRPYIVKLTNLEGNSGGTGFYVKTPSGKIVTLTNGHVCRLAVNGVLMSRTDTDVDAVNVIAQYEDNDLCIVDAPEGTKTGFRVALYTRNTENIYVLGHPLLEPKTLTKGQLSGNMTIDVLQGYNVVPCEGKTYRQVLPDPNDLMAALLGIKYACIRTSDADIITANILPGNSGSPVLNAFGHVVGVVYAGSPGTGRGFIVPLTDVKEFLKDK